MNRLSATCDKEELRNFRPTNSTFKRVDDGEYKIFSIFSYEAGYRELFSNCFQEIFASEKNYSSKKQLIGRSAYL